MREKVLLSWSGGKDSALALHETQQQHDIAALLTTVTEDYDRISMHGVRTSLLQEQARSLDIPLEKVLLSRGCTNEEYESKMRDALEKYRAAGVLSVVFGDIFLEDVRRYREEKLLTAGMKGLFPLWHRDTGQLAQHFLALGFRAVLCCVDTHVLDQQWAGRLYDESLLDELSPGIDLCGERGEFHSFVFDGPNFGKPVAYRLGERVLRENRFYYCDLLTDI